jgi:hypothetical protein
MKKPKNRPEKRVHDATGCRSLIVIDQKPIRKKALAEFRRAQKALLKNRQELSHHLNVVRPSYLHWITGIAGEKMEKVATLQNQLRERAIFLDRIEQWVYEEFLPPRQAYAFANQEYEEAKNQADLGNREEGAPNFESSDEDLEDPFDEEVIFEKRFEEMASFTEGGRPRKKRDRREFDFIESHKKEKEQKIKNLYRQMARMLHPDTGLQSNGSSRELWSEVAAAYQANDLETLEMLSVSVQVISDPQARTVGIFDLNRLSRFLIGQSRRINQEIKLLSRQNPAWKFESKDRNELAKKILADISRTERAIGEMLEEIESRIRIYQKRAEKRKKRSGCSRRSTLRLNLRER